MLPTKKLINYIISKIDYFRNNPKHLAWAMTNFELLRRAEIFKGTHIQNPIHEALCCIEEEKDRNLIKAAWDICSTVNHMEFHDACFDLPLEFKKNKTLQEWIELHTQKNKNTNRESIINFLLCASGSGLKWNSDGYLAEMVNNIDKIVFAGYTHVTDVPQEIKNSISKIMDVEELEEIINELRNQVTINAGDNKAEKRLVNNKNYILHLLEYATSDRQKEKILYAFEYVCYLETLIDEAKEWTEEQWQTAVEQDTFEFNRMTFDISKIGMDYCTSLEQFRENVYKCTKQRTMSLPDYRINPFYTSARFMLWQNFVYKIENIDENVKQALSILSKNSSLRRMALDLGSVEKEKFKDKQEALEVLKSHRPNYKKYYPLLIAAGRYGDANAIKQLNKAAKVPDRGWDTIWYFSFECENEIANYLWEHVEKRYIKSYTYTNLTKHSNLVTMPIYADISYIEEGIKLATAIINNPEESCDSDIYARQFLTKHLNKVINKKIEI